MTNMVHAVVFVCARYSHLYTFGSEAEGDAFKRGAEDHGDGVMVLVLPRDREKLGGFDKNEADLALAAVEDAIDVAANGPELGVEIDW